MENELFRMSMGLSADNHRSHLESEFDIYRRAGAHIPEPADRIIPEAVGFARERHLALPLALGGSLVLTNGVSAAPLMDILVQKFSWGPTIFGGIAGGIGGFLWELVDGSSANKVHGVRTKEGVGLTHEGSDFAELFTSSFGGALIGASMGAGLTKGIDSKFAYLLGLVGTLPGLLICRASKQQIWPLKR